jgi:hypothetical protein
VTDEIRGALAFDGSDDARIKTIDDRIELDHPFDAPSTSPIIVCEARLALTVAFDTIACCMQQEV